MTHVSFHLIQTLVVQSHQLTTRSFLTPGTTLWTNQDLEGDRTTQSARQSNMKPTFFFFHSTKILLIFRTQLITFGKQKYLDTFLSTFLDFSRI